MGEQNDDVVSVTRAIRAARIARAGAFAGHKGNGHSTNDYSSNGNSSNGNSDSDELAANDESFVEVRVPDVDDPDAQQLVEEHLWLVDRMVGQAARRFPRYVERSELWSAGVLGLVEAARRYTPSYNVPFAAYASARVRGEMMSSMRSGDIAPRRLRASLRELTAVVESLTQELGRVPTLAEVATAAGIDVEVVRSRMYSAAKLKTTSLDDESSPAQGDQALTTTSTEPSERLNDREMLGALREAVSELPEPLKSILVRSNWNNERLVDIAADMGISFQRVAQYRVEAITALAAWFATLYEAVPAPDPSLPGAVRRAAYCAALASQSTWRARLDAGKSADDLIDDLQQPFARRS